MEYEITYQDGSTLTTSVDEHLAVTVDTNYKDEVRGAIAAFDKWLDNDFTQDTFSISSLMRPGN
jgi:hypothetical protein